MFVRVLVLAVALALSPAFQAAEARAALSPEAKCRDAVAKSARHALNLVVSTRALCLKHRVRKLIPASVDCLADPASLGGPGTGDSTIDGKLAAIAQWRQKRAATVARACTGVDLEAAGVGGSCPASADTAAEIAACAVDEGKEAGDALAATVNVVPAPSGPSLAWRKCYDVVTRSLSYNPRTIDRIRADCFAADEVEVGDYACLATSAPPGIVSATGHADTDDLLAKRTPRWRNRVLWFCQYADLSMPNLAAPMGDPTGGLFTTDDLVERMFDAILAGAHALHSVSLPQDPSCGDGATTAGEECDDGDHASCDGCDRDCSVTACGNGAACAPEACDDGNTSPGDGCSAACNVEAPGCGNDFIDPGEQCDDGPANSDTTPNACRTDCTLPGCGDTVVDSGEECDPPDGTTCDASCQLLLCGNGAVDAGEDCDEGAETAGCDDDCSFPACPDGNHNVLAGETCDTGGNSATCDSDCSVPACGDSLPNMAAGEGCDDGNLVDADGCDSNCTPTGCGNGIVTAPEACDDGNLTSGDGCSATCTCVGEPGCFTQDPHCPDRGQLTLWAGTTSVPCATNADCDAGECDNGLGVCITQTELDTGYSGISHNADINDQARVMGSLLCPGPAPICGECVVAGLEPDFDNCRCANDNRAVCDQPFAADADDCGGQICNCYFGAPLPLSAGATPACVVNRFANDIFGTANIDTGAGQITANLKSVVFLGIGTADPCPVCGGTCTAPPAEVGQPCSKDPQCDSSLGAGDGVCGMYDPVLGDGNRDGVCIGGANNGLSCDGGSLNTTFPSPANGGGGSHSLDCFPDSGLNVSGAGLAINLSQTTGSVSLSANVDCGYDFPGGARECPCGRCSGDESVGCASNADCTGIGTCAREQQGTPYPNTCADEVCTDLGGGEGTCLAGPVEKYCDGLTRANGDGFYGCLQNSDCSALSIGAAGGGNCTLLQDRRCFLNPITATGIQDANAPLGVATFCVGLTANGGINTVAGLPGPARIKNQATSRLFCASNPLVEYEPGVGGCP